MVLSTGTRLGPYEILSPLGAGGMGEVYRAKDSKLRRDVAIKVLPQSLAADPDALARFEREALAVAALSHPNILAIHDFGREGDTTYAVTELLEGETLRRKLDAGPIPEKLAVDFALQIARGLAAAHEKGVVHRDLKPENLFVTRDGHLKILDFGLAKKTEPDRDDDQTSSPTASRHTTPGTVMGTVGYMSPEQVKGLPVDHRSDIFSFGAILYELLSGKMAFKRDSAAETAAAILMEQLPPPSGSGPDISPALEQVVRHCVTKDRDQRFQSARDIVFALEQSTASSTATKVTPAGPRSLKRRAILAGAALVLLGVLTAAAPRALDKVVVKFRLRAVPSEKRLAILPFQVAGPNEEDRALADGISDQLAVRLTQLERFQRTFSVESTSNVRRSGVTSADMAAKALGVNLVVTGNVRRIGDRLVFATSLEDADAGRTLRAENAESLPELLDKVVGILDLTIGAEGRAELRASGTSVAEAAVLSAQALGHTPYAEGRSALERADDAKNVERAIELFDKALELDPHYVLAHAGISEAYWRLFAATRKSEYIGLARAHCERALALDDLVAGVWEVQGMIEVGTGNAEKAIQSYKRALDRNPRSASARSGLGYAYEALGRFEDARAEYDEAIKLRPDDWKSYSYLGAFLANRDRPKEAEAAFRNALRFAPDNPGTWSNLGSVLYFQNRMAEAESAFARSIALYPNRSAISNLGTLQYFQGRYADAAGTLEKATQIGTRDYLCWWNLASALFWVPGERERAAGPYRRTMELCEEERTINPRDPMIVVTLADCYAHLGEPERARSFVAEALRMGPMSGILARTASGVYEEVGDRSEALRWIGEALKAGYSREEIENDPAFTELRAESRYRATIEPEKGKTN